MSAPTTHPHDEPLPPPATVEVADGVFAYVQLDGSWWINNTGFVAGRDGVAVVDTCATERRTPDFITAIRERTAAPLRTPLNTHHHRDHTNGNRLFPDTALLRH